MQRSRLQHRHAVWLLVLSLIAGACAGTSQPSEPDSPDVPTSTAADEGVASGIVSSSTTVDDLSAEPPPDPLVLVFDHEDASSVTAEIGHAGGVLEATSAAGVGYALKVPEGALFSPVAITMTPVTLSDSPLEGATVAAVALEPDGLVFLESAMLEITNTGMDAAQAATFGTEADGSEFHAEVGTVGDVVEVRVAHFSVSGTIAAEKEKDQILLAYKLESRANRAVQGTEAVFQYVKDPIARHDAISEAMVDWFIAIGTDAESAQDPVAADAILGEFLYARNVLDHYQDVLRAPLEEASAMESWAAEAVQELMYRMFKQENLRCIQDRDPEAAFAMLKWGYLYQWLIQTGYGSAERIDDIIAALKQCLRFRLEFESQVAIPQGFDSHVEADVDLILEEEGTLGILNGELVYPIVVGQLTGIAISNAGEKLECATVAPIDVVLAFEATIQIGHISDSQFDEQDIWVRPYEETNFVCDHGINVKQAPWLPWFAKAFADLRDEDGFYHLALVQTSNGDPYAEAFEASRAEGADVTFGARLVHDPQLP